MTDDDNDVLDRFPVNREPHPAEWAVGVASAIGIIVLIGYLVVTAITESDRPPEFVATVEEIVETGSHWHVRVSIRNDGDKTAADVLLRGEADAEKSETTFDYVPAGSSRTGALLFEAEPAGLSLSIRSYTDP